MYICVFVWLYATCVWMPKEAQRRYWIPWSWTYRWLWATWSECWEPNSGPLEEMPALFNYWATSQLFVAGLFYLPCSVFICVLVCAIILYCVDHNLSIFSSVSGHLGSTMFQLSGIIQVRIWAYKYLWVLRACCWLLFAVMLTLCKASSCSVSWLHWLSSHLVLTRPKGCKVASYYECVECFSNEWH